MSIKDVEFFVPCQPGWLCEPFILFFSVLVLIGFMFFVRLVYREYKRIERSRKVIKHRKVHYTIRKNMNKPYKPLRQPRNKKR